MTMGKWLIFHERGFVKISTEVSESGHQYERALPNTSFNIMLIMR